MDNEQPASQFDEDSLHALRGILLHQEHRRLEHLEEKIRTLQLTEEQLSALLKELKNEHADTTALIERITPAMPGMVRHSIRTAGPEIAETLGPIMGDAIRVQIRDSRDEMADALSPVIGAAIQKAIARFSAELQRNIDAQLKSAFEPIGASRLFVARLLGVSNSRMALRKALPFQMKEIFLIHRTSGLMIAHSHQDGIADANADLMSSMLTAIRSFASDAFNGQDELDEIQFGGDRILIQGAAYAYIAVVISGIEPEGFRARLAEFIANLHLRTNNALRDFSGDPTSLPNFQPLLAQLITGVSQTNQKPALTRQQKIGLTLTGILFLLLTFLFCFYIWFSVRLFPVAFPAYTQTPAATRPLTSTPTLTVTATETKAPTSTGTAVPTVTSSPAAVTGITTGSFYIRPLPTVDSASTAVVLQDTPVLVLAVYGEWLEISWVDEHGAHQGWILAKRVSVQQSFPPAMITPTP